MKYLGLSQSEAIQKDLDTLEALKGNLEARIASFDDKEQFRSTYARSVMQQNAARARDTLHECEDAIERVKSELTLAQDAEKTAAAASSTTKKGG